MSLHLDDLRRARPLIEAFLLEGVVVLGPERKVHLITWKARDILGRRERDPVRMFGEDTLHELCDPILEGTATRVLWRDVTVPGDDARPRHITARSLPMRLSAERPGVLILVADTSSEIGLADQNARLVEELREANRDLRTQIAAELRAHEDDVVQFAEILQIAPVIFASFVEEAHRALASLAEARARPSDQEARRVALQDLHTLKGNARSLGLNLIGGRAHAVEDLFASLRSGHLGPRDSEDLEALSEQLSHAVGRAETLSERLGESQSEIDAGQPGASPQGDAELLSVDASLERALARLGGEAEAREAVLEARRRLHAAFRLPLSGLLHHLKTTALTVAQAAGREAPRVRLAGGRLRVPAPVYRALTASLPHLVRNAVVHGIEDADGRRAAGKPLASTLDVSAAIEGDDLVVRVRDDGRGIDLETLRAQAAENGADRAGEIADVDLVAGFGLSTASSVSRDAGRGTGMAAARDAIGDAGGTLALEETRPGGGTSFSVRLRLWGAP